MTHRATVTCVMWCEQGAAGAESWRNEEPAFVKFVRRSDAGDARLNVASLARAQRAVTPADTFKCVMTKPN